MKVRNDFVSNSSSSSFICAVNSTYSIKDFAKDLGKSCTNKKARYHDPELADRNRMILEFCLNTYELLYLGRLNLETTTEELTYESLKKKLAELYDRDIVHLDSIADDHWHYYIDGLKRARSGASEWDAKEFGRDSYDEKTGIYTHVEDHEVGELIVTTDTMTYEFGRHHYKAEDGIEHDEKPDNVASRVKNIVEAAKAYEKDGQDKDVWIYQITADTLKNTRNLIDAGHKLSFDKWEDLDSIEQRLNAGEKIFYIRQAHDGDGYGNFYIYGEDGCGGIDHIAAEVLGSECM